MRRVILAAVVASLGGCASFQQGLENEKRASDLDRTGIQVGGANDPVLTAGGPATPGPAPAAEPRGKHRPAKAVKTKAKDLPGGLGGDTQHRAYTGDVPK